MKRARTADSVVSCGLYTPIIQFRTSGVPAGVTAVTEKPDWGVGAGYEAGRLCGVPGQSLEPLAELPPVGRRRLGEHQRGATGVQHDARPYLEHALTKAAQAPAGASDLLHHAPSAVQDLVGKQMQQQQCLVAGERLGGVRPAGPR